MNASEDIEKLLADRESDRVERTASFQKNDKLGQAVCAFANDMPGHGKPGYFFVGVDDAGVPTGLAVTDELLKSLAAVRDNGNIVPIPSMVVGHHEVDGHEVAYVRVEPSDMPPVRYKSDVWIRVGPRRGRASAQEERQLNERRIDRAHTWDLRACREASLEDLAMDRFTLNYLPAAVSRETLDENDRPPEHQLSALRFWHTGFKCPTNAAILAFGTDPERFFPGAYVQYLAFEGTRQSDPVLEERRMSGDLYTVLSALDELARTLARVRPVRDESMRERDVADYPWRALHELFMNAIIHRNYEGSTTPVAIHKYEDRLEVYNPGGLYGDMSEDQLFVGTAYRNLVLAEAAKTFGFVNKFGVGLDIVRDELEKNGSPPLEPQIQPNHVLMLVRKRP